MIPQQGGKIVGDNDVGHGPSSVPASARSETQPLPEPIATYLEKVTDTTLTRNGDILRRDLRKLLTEERTRIPLVTDLLLSDGAIAAVEGNVPFIALVQSLTGLHNRDSRILPLALSSLDSSTPQFHRDLLYELIGEECKTLPLDERPELHAALIQHGLPSFCSRRCHQIQNDPKSRNWVSIFSSLDDVRIAPAIKDELLHRAERNEHSGSEHLLAALRSISNESVVQPLQELAIVPKEEPKPEEADPPSPPTNFRERLLDAQPLAGFMTAFFAGGHLVATMGQAPFWVYVLDVAGCQVMALGIRQVGHMAGPRRKPLPEASNQDAKVELAKRAITQLQILTAHPTLKQQAAMALEQIIQTAELDSDLKEYLRD